MENGNFIIKADKIIRDYRFDLDQYINEKSTLIVWLDEKGKRMFFKSNQIKLQDIENNRWVILSTENHSKPQYITYLDFNKVTQFVEQIGLVHGIRPYDISSHVPIIIKGLHQLYEKNLLIDFKEDPSTALITGDPNNIPLFIEIDVTNYVEGQILKLSNKLLDKNIAFSEDELNKISEDGTHYRTLGIIKKRI